LLGGRPPWTLFFAWPPTFVLLAITLRERRRRGGGPAPGIGALAGFVALALGTTVPLPPALLRLLSTATARLYAEMLPGWPGEGASGAFINANHFAAWLEMVIPAGLAYLVAVVGRVRRRLKHAAEAGRGMGVGSKRAWVAALIAHQRRLWAPLVAAAALAAMG